LKKVDLAVVGAGILGIFSAYHAAKAGHSVALFEAGALASGASVRNFGQVIPSGQALGAWRHLGVRSLEIYRELHAGSGVPMRQEGSCYVAGDEQELRLLEEMAELDRLSGYESKLLGIYDALNLHPALHPESFSGALYYPQEITVDSPTMIDRLHTVVGESPSVTNFSACAVVGLEPVTGGTRVVAADGTTILARQALLCCGHFVQTLMPEAFQLPELRLVRLQLMETKPLAYSLVTGNFLSGLSIRRYPAFRSCPSRAHLPDPHDRRELVKEGIHILCNHRPDGALVLGDSHHYCAASEPPDYHIDMRVSALILSEAKRILDLNGTQVVRQWNGYYSEMENDALFRQTLGECIHIVTGLGGKGMTTAPALAELVVAQIMADRSLEELVIATELGVQA